MTQNNLQPKYKNTTDQCNRLHIHAIINKLSRQNSADAETTVRRHLIDSMHLTVIFITDGNGMHPNVQYNH